MIHSFFAAATSSSMGAAAARWVHPVRTDRTKTLATKNPNPFIDPPLARGSVNVCPWLLRKPQDLPVFPGESIDRLGLVLGHVYRLFPFHVFGGLGSRDKCRGPAGELFPNLLTLGRGKKESEKVSCAGMWSVAQHPGVPCRGNHRLDPVSKGQRHPLDLCSVDELVDERDRDQDLTQLEAGGKLRERP